MKKLLIVYSLLFSGLISADELGDILSSTKLDIFEYQSKDNKIQSKKLLKSWINPISVSYQKNFSKQFGDDTIKTARFNIGINQPIFRSGGIYYAIKYATVQKEANAVEIARQKRKMVADAVSILFDLKKLSLQQEKTKLLIKNDSIDIMQKRDSYRSGLLDSSFLDRAILQRSQNETALLQMKLTKLELKQKFSLLSDKKPEKLKLPTLKLMDKSRYENRNLTIKRDKLKVKKASYNEKITWAKYLPTIAVNANYINEDINPLFARSGSSLKEEYYNYALSISMPLDVNSFADIEGSRVAKLKMMTEALESKMTVEKEYEWIVQTLLILDENIALAQKDEKIYHNLYRLTKNLAQAGEKTRYDVELMENSLKVRRLDQEIYEIDKQKQLLKLYARMEDAI